MKRVKVHGYKKHRGRKVFSVKAHKRTVITKGELVKKLSEKYKELKHKDINDVLGSTTEMIGHELKQGHDVRINGLGTFKVKVKPARPAHRGINPFTKKEQNFPAKPATKVVKFKPASELKP